MVKYVVAVVKCGSCGLGGGVVSRVVERLRYDPTDILLSLRALAAAAIVTPMVSRSTFQWFAYQL